MDEGDIAPRGEGGVEDKREAGEPFWERAREMGQGINWEVFSNRVGWDIDSPIEGEVD